MIVSFFEEFPDKRSKDALIDWESNLYLASHSVREFKTRSKRFRHFKKKVFWPVLKKQDGYWLSPFSRKSALYQTLHDIERNGREIPVMLDLELPFSRNPMLFLTELPNAAANKKRITGFIRNRENIFTCEYYPEKGWRNWIFRCLGLTYPAEYGNSMIKMLYHSMHRFDEDFVREEIRTGVKVYGGRFIVAYGAIAHGVLGNEPVLLPDQLERDLRIAKDEGAHEVIIFRLAGLDDRFAKVIRKIVRN